MCCPAIHLTMIEIMRSPSATNTTAQRKPGGFRERMWEEDSVRAEVGSVDVRAGRHSSIPSGAYLTGGRGV
jgi:hypothetical protein